MKDYLILFDSDGNRTNTYASGVHYNVDDAGNATDGSIKVQDLLDKGYIFVSQDDYSNLLGNNEKNQIYVYQNKAFIPKPETVLTDDEKKSQEAATAESDYSSQISDLKDSLTTAQLSGDTDLVTELQQEYTDLMTEYNKKLEEINNG